jgi:hypothetical protein
MDRRISSASLMAWTPRDRPRFHAAQSDRSTIGRFSALAPTPLLRRYCSAPWLNSAHQVFGSTHRDGPGVGQFVTYSSGDFFARVAGTASGRCDSRRPIVGASLVPHRRRVDRVGVDPRALLEPSAKAPRGVASDDRASPLGALVEETCRAVARSAKATSEMAGRGIAYGSDRRLLRGRLLSSSFSVGGVAPTNELTPRTATRGAQGVAALQNCSEPDADERRLAFHLDTPEAFRVKVTVRRSISSRFVGRIT